MDQTPAELLRSILNTAERHPNAKVSKLIKGFEVERTPQNIALLLIELAEHPEFSADITISLKYYLDCLNELRQEPSFAEAGIILFNSSKIYAKRVDHIHHEIENLILSLSNVENTKENISSPDTIQNTAKVKRGRKRTLEQINCTIEADMSVKRFKKISNNKRFECVIPKRNNFIKNLVRDSDKSMKNYIPQSTWQHSAIEDFDYEDEVDSKKNYKLFTYHLEHRYNTLISDINFKMYFKIKDFINGDCNDSELPESWPPLSDAYIEQFLNLEDVILIKEGHLKKAREKIDTSRSKDHCVIKFNNSNSKNDHLNTTVDSGIQVDINSSVLAAGPQAHLNISESVSMQYMDCQTSHCEINTSANSLDSGIELETSVESQATGQSQLSLLETNLLSEDSSNTSKSGIGIDVSSPTPEQMVNDTPALRTPEQMVNVSPSLGTTEQLVNDSPALTNEHEIQTNNKELKGTEYDLTLLDPSASNTQDLSTLKIILPHLPDEGVYFSNLEERDRQMLSPFVVAQDVFRCVKDKSNIVIKVDDAIEQLFQIREPSDEFLSLPFFQKQNIALVLNILKIPLKYFQKQRRFKLGPEFQLPKKERLKKYLKRSSIVTCSPSIKLMRINKEVIIDHISPPASPSYEPDFLGFPEDLLMDKNRTLSRDSGISIHQTDREIIEDFVNSFDMISNNIIPIPLENESTETGESLKPTITVSEELPASLERTNIERVEEFPSEGNRVVETLNNTCQDNQTSELDEETQVRTKVQEWHTHLQPILACSRERHHFDVFAIGTEIMTQFDRNDVCSEKVSFKNVMEKKDESLISRYFLSMLLLANQGNILIDVQNKNTNKPSELHDIRLKLITRKRNIISLEDNIGLTVPPVSTTQIDLQPAAANIRTLKNVPENTKMDDLDSGVGMSEASSII